MKMVLYSIYDSLAQESSPVFESKNNSTAIRACLEVFRGPDHPSVEGYQLQILGEVEHDDGVKINLFDTVISINLEREFTAEPLGVENV
nr:MAG: nonstructural protein [Microvirus sp.]